MKFVVEVLASGEVVSCGSFIEGAAYQPLKDGKLIVHTEFVVPGNVRFKDGVFLPIPPKPTQDHQYNYQTNQWEVDLEKVAERVKAIRNKLLADCDWTQLPDVPEPTRSAWLSYRQSLRDITIQDGYPTAVIWPTPPV